MQDRFEEAAKAIYRLFEGSEQHPWVEGGNSDKQEEARGYAYAAISSGVRGRYIKDLEDTLGKIGKLVGIQNDADALIKKVQDMAENQKMTVEVESQTYQTAIQNVKNWIRSEENRKESNPMTLFDATPVLATAFSKLQGVVTTDLLK